MHHDWQRGNDGPCIGLGTAGAFDDMHLFAPCVAYENGVYSMWYSGSQDTVAQRVFTLGLATSTDGIHFAKDPRSPVCRFTGSRSILTPTLLRHPDGSLCREDGRVRMWFSCCDFPSGDPRHTLHETSSLDGVTWDEPSDEELADAYAPTLIKEGERYKLWFTDVRQEPWCFRYAESNNGRDWDLAPDPVLIRDQDWEHHRLFYPTVLKIAGQYWMWYGSYSHHGGEEMQTALGCAYSDDGLHWHKDEHNPVFGPDPSRSWESHYTTSQTILRLENGSLRIWYASRPAPPFENKYFAVGTAQWEDPP